MELSIPYIFETDGARAVVGNSDEAQDDPDFVGFLDPENGITGILDGADHRVVASDLVEADGSTFGPTWLSGRPGTVQGLILPVAGLDSATVNAALEKLERATRALRLDGWLRWTPSGSSLERQLRFRRTAAPAVTRRRPKAFQFAITSPDAYITSSSEASLVITPGLAAGELGIANPITDPITSDLNVTGQAFVVNQGTAETWPRFQIAGPITNPEILNNTTGERIRLIFDLAVGETLDVMPRNGQILFNGTADRYGAYDFALSSWWQLLPGNNDVRLLASAYSTGAAVTVYWRHAWAR